MTEHTLLNICCLGNVSVQETRNSQGYLNLMILTTGMHLRQYKPDYNRGCFFIVNLILVEGIPTLSYFHGKYEHDFSGGNIILVVHPCCL